MIVLVAWLGEGHLRCLQCPVTLASQPLRAWTAHALTAATVEHLARERAPCDPDAIHRQWLRSLTALRDERHAPEQRQLYPVDYGWEDEHDDHDGP